MKGFLFFSIILLSLNIYCQNNYIRSELSHSYGSTSPTGGVSFIDFNNDGLDDLTLATDDDNFNFFYLSDNQGGLTRIDLQLDKSITTQLLWQDIDNDNDKDLLIINLGSPNKLYLNVGEFNYVDVTPYSGLIQKNNNSSGASFADINNDGFLDLFILNYNRNSSNEGDQVAEVYINKGDGSFTEVTSLWNADIEGKVSFCGSFFDYDFDGDQDFYIANDFGGGNVLLENIGSSFLDVSAESNAGVEIQAMSTTIGDINDDQLEDIYSTNLITGNVLLLNDTSNVFISAADSLGLSFNGIAWGAIIFDLDNDMDNDLYVSASSSRAGSNSAVPSKLYYNENNGFRSFIIPGDTADSYASAIGDLNNDGYYDVGVNNRSPDQSHLLINNAGVNNYIKIKLAGRVSNRDAVGTKVEYYIDDMGKLYTILSANGFRGQNSDQLILPLAQNDKVDSLIIKWPGGIEDIYYNVDAGNKYFFYENDSHKPAISAPFICSSGSDSLLVSISPFAQINWSNNSSNHSTYYKYGEEINVNFLYKGRWFSLDTVFVKEEPINPSFIVNEPSCFDASDGSIALSDTTNSSRFIWSTFDTGYKIENLNSGRYAYTIKTNYGCADSRIITLTAPDELSIDYDISYKAEGMILEFNVTGGVGPYKYFYQGEEVAETIRISPGFVFLSVEDGNGCFKELQFTVDNILHGNNETEGLIFPVPVRSGSFFNINFEYSELKIYDQNGKIVKQYRNVDRIIAPETGVYNLLFELNNSTYYTRRLIVE